MDNRTYFKIISSEFILENYLLESRNFSRHNVDFGKELVDCRFCCRNDRIRKEQYTLSVTKFCHGMAVYLIVINCLK